MNKKEILQIITAFVISLVINIPIAYAQLTNPKVYGQDMVKGAVRNETDLFTFEVTAKIDNETIKEGQVRLWGSGYDLGFPFTSCTKNQVTGSYDCKLENMDLSDFLMCPVHMNDINLYDANKALVSTAKVESFCDNKNPDIIRFQTNKNVYNAGDEVEFTIDIKDKGDVDNKCAGLKNALLEINDYSDYIWIDNKPGECSYSGKVLVNASLLSEGNLEARLTAYDGFGLSAIKIITFSTDFSAPDIKEIEITKEDGSEIGYFIPNQQLYADIKVNFTDDNNLDSGYSVLESNDLGIANSKANYCNNNQCVWDNKRITMKKPSSIITVTLVDSVGNYNKKNMSYSFVEDKTKPAIKNLKVTDRQNNDIAGWISGSTLGGYVYADITEAESGLDKGSIKANLEGLNIGGYYTNVKASSCSEGENGTRCRWDVEISLNESKSVSLIFSASDRAGNNASESLTYSFKVDNLGPIAKDIKTDTVYNGEYYVKGIGNTFRVGFTEDGAGLDAAFLDLSELGAGVKQANNCSNNVCYWYNIGVSKGDGIYKVKVGPETKDKLGNRLQNTLEIDVKVDVTAPIVKSIKAEPVAGSNPLIEGYIQTGNALIITAAVYEPTALTASGDFSRFIKDAKSASTVCYVEDSTWTCTWETSEINIPDYIVGYLRFNFTDFMGNTEMFEQPLIVLAAENETLDYWKNEIGKPSPSGIDKELVALYDPFIWFPVDLEAKGDSKIWPLSVELGECINAEGESYGAYLSSEFGNKPELFNYNSAEPGTLPYKIYLKYSLERAEPPKDELPIKCNLKIRTLVNKQRISQIETENITVEIPYYYNPLGTLDGNIKAEINRVSNGWLVEAKWIETFNNILNFARTICRFVNSYYSLVTIYAYIKSLLSGACALTAGLGCAAAAKQGVIVELNKLKLHRIYDTYAYKWCKLLNCQLSTEKEFKGFTNILLGRMRTAYSKEGYWGNVDPQHSLILSVYSLCLPGVLYNLQKARVIDCQYVNCLKEAEVGVPIQYCSAQRSYGYCKFVWGEVFNLIPWAAAASYLVQNVKRALSHPLESIGFAISVPCRLMCTSATPVGVGCFACTVAEHFNLLLEVLCDLGVGKGCEPVWDELKVDDSICKSITEEKKSEEGTPEV